MKDITARAGVNRATFYRHFEDKYALVSYIFGEAVEQILSEVGPPAQHLEELAWLSVKPGTPAKDPASREMQHAVDIMTRLFEHFVRQAKLYRAMLGRNGSPWFANQMRAYIAGVFQQRLQASHLLTNSQVAAQNIMPPQMATLCLAHWFVGMLTWWMESGLVASPKQMATWSLNFVVHGYYHSLGF